MKKFKTLLIALAVVSTPLCAAPTTPPKMGIVNFRHVVEQSKLGKHEQETFEAMREQMEKIIGDKEQELTEIGKKLQDEDYLDSLTPDAENELKHKFRVASQEMQQIQNQFMQALQQANMKLVQGLAEKISKASEQVAQKHNLDVVVNGENLFYQKPNLDISDLVVEEMDRQFQEEQKNAPKAG